jgi:UTP:GlnB (protein PII) uridylyltransferase
MNQIKTLTDLIVSYFESFVKQANESSNIAKSSLNERKQGYQKLFGDVYQNFRRKMAEGLLAGEGANDIVRNYTAWMDAWMQFTWSFAVEERYALMEELLHTSDEKLVYIKKNLPRKLKRKKELETFLFSDKSEKPYMDPAERSYYISRLKEIQFEIEELQKEKEAFRKIVPKFKKTETDPKQLLKVLQIFARGGYGREELTFASDIDIGYCLNLDAATGLEVQTIQEIIKRMGDLLQGTGLDFAAQYFELGEDLTRFAKTSMLHTIPSVLEGRSILGASDNLKHLKNQLLQICPQEKIVRFLQNQMDGIVKKDNESFDIKEGFGGIRHLQLALWMVLIVVNHESGNSKAILEFLQGHNWITAQDKTNLLQALEFYFDFRNFLGLFDCLSDRLEQLGIADNFEVTSINNNYLDNRTSFAYLHLIDRFADIDHMDRFRLHSINAVARLSRSIVDGILDQTVLERLNGFILYKHLGTNQITRFEATANEASSRLNLENKNDFIQFFHSVGNLLELLLYIANTGNVLKSGLVDRFSELIPTLYDSINLKESDQFRDFIFQLFTSENTAAAVKQMIEISAPLNRKGEIKTLLGLFLPEVNKMRYLLRNTEIHEYPLCIHSIKVLEQVEQEMEIIQKDEPGLWRFISEEDIFALKWSALFHDLGKIDPHANHEEFGPVLSSNMLLRLGWTEESDTLHLIRLLVSNHQSVVRFSQLATFMDLGILKFFELAQRDPRKVIMLYLVNLADFKSVNSEMSKKSAHLENFFNKTMGILEKFKQQELSGSMTEIVNQYLDEKVAEIRQSVLVEVLLRQCINTNLDDTIILPLRKLSIQQSDELEKYRKELENSLVYLKLAELDSSSLDKHRYQFTQIIKRVISNDNILSIVSPLSGYWNWFFTAIPNRYLLSSSVQVLTSQLQQFEASRYRKIKFSFVKGEVGEYDTILFYAVGDLSIQARIAYALGWRGVNIESGKVNKVIYDNKEEGLVGYYKVSQRSGTDALSNIELETVITNLKMPPLNPPPFSELKESNIQLKYFPETEKGYLVQEVDKELFSRVRTDFEAVRISLNDAPFCYYKIMRSFEAMGIVPQQVIITTIGKQIIDHFHVSPWEKEKMQRDDFGGLLHKYMHAEISVS